MRAGMNAFDLVVTVALGSTLATVLLSKGVALAEGLLGFALLIGLQWAVAKRSLRSPRFNRLVNAEPRLLLHRGRFLDGALHDERVARDEVMAALRASGVADAAGVAAVVLETDGSLNVIRDAPPGTGASALKGVAGPEH